MLDLLSSTSHYHLPKHSLVIRTFNEKAQRFKKSQQMQVVYKRKKKKSLMYRQSTTPSGARISMRIGFFFF